MRGNDQFLIPEAGLAIGLAAVAWALFRVIGWLRKSPSRYFYFDLFASLFVLGFGLLFLSKGPRGPFFVWMGIGMALSGGVGLGALLSQRFGITGPSGVKYSSRRKGLLRCSFCNKSQRDVAKLIAGPNVYICDECVGICQVILSEDSGPPEAPQPEPTAPAN